MSKRGIKEIYKILFLRCICLAACMIGALQMAVESFGLELHLGIVAAFIVVDCLFFGIGKCGKKTGKIFWYGWNIPWFAGGLLRWKTVLSGYLVLENCVRASLDRYYGITLARRQIPVEEEQGEYFLILLFSVLILALGHLVVQKGRTAMLILIMVLIFILELLCGNTFQGWGLYLTAGSILILTAMRYFKGIRNNRILCKTGCWAAGMVLSLTIVCELVLGPLLYQHAENWNADLYQKVQQITDQAAAVMRSQNGLWGNHDPAADGSLNNYPVEQDQQTDLIVTLPEKPEYSVYLRGFVGDTYEGDYWHRSDDQAFYDVFGNGDGAYQVQNILYRYLAGKAEEEAGSVLVERINPGGEYGYVPYGFETPNSKNLYGDSYYSSADKENMYTGYTNWRRWLGPGAALSVESEVEARYREYVADQYLKVPSRGLERLKEYCNQKDYTTVQEVIDFVAEDVKNGREYSMDLEPVPVDEDFTEYFFFEQKKGYCIHFATTATLMLRLMGVPARYVTGYVASPDAFVEKETGYVAEIPDTKAHAWVEVYRAGKGWIPLEVTPGYSTGINQGGVEESVQQAFQPSEIPVPETGEPDTVSVTVSPEPSQTEQTGESGQNTDQTQTGNEGKAAGSRKLPVILLMTVVTAAVIAGFWMGIRANRKRVLQKRRRMFFQENCNSGICEISYALYQMLCDAGLCVAAAGDLEFAGKMEEKLDCIETGAFVHFIRTVQEAAYSQESISEEIRQECYEFYKKIAGWLWSSMSGYKKIIWKYIKCCEIP